MFTSPDEARGPFDLVFEVVGRAETIELGWRLLDSGGTVVVVGIAPAGVDATIPSHRFLIREDPAGVLLRVREPGRRTGRSGRGWQPRARSI